MASLENFIYCLNAERVVNENGEIGSNINALGVLATITPEYVPGAFSFSVIFTVLGVDMSSAENTVQVKFCRENDDKILVDSGILQLPAMPDDTGIELPGEYKGLNMSMDCRNVVFESEGVYVARIYFNEKFLGEKKIYVKGKRMNG